MSVFNYRLFGITTSLTIVFAALLALLLSVVSAQVWKDGEAVDSIEHVLVDDGDMLENYDHIDQATMTGGVVHNVGRIEEMLYFGGVCTKCCYCFIAVVLVSCPNCLACGIP